jgi:hypothetical protein
LLLLWYRAGEVCERVRKVVTGETAPVRRHRGGCLVIAGIRVFVELDSVGTRKDNQINRERAVPNSRLQSRGAMQIGARHVRSLTNDGLLRGANGVESNHG